MAKKVKKTKKEKFNKAATPKKNHGCTTTTRTRTKRPSAPPKVWRPTGGCWGTGGWSRF